MYVVYSFSSSKALYLAVNSEIIWLKVVTAAMVSFEISFFCNFNIKIPYKAVKQTSTSLVSGPAFDFLRNSVMFPRAC